VDRLADELVARGGHQAEAAREVFDEPERVDRPELDGAAPRALPETVDPHRQAEALERTERELLAGAIAAQVREEVVALVDLDRKSVV